MRTVDIKVLPDGSGRVRIHWFRRLDTGPIQLPSAVLPSSRGPIPYRGPRGCLACQPGRKDVSPRLEGRVHYLTHYSDDIRAVTCPECLATPEAQAMLKQYEELAEVIQVESKG